MSGGYELYLVFFIIVSSLGSVFLQHQRDRIGIDGPGAVGLAMIVGGLIGFVTAGAVLSWQLFQAHRGLS